MTIKICPPATLRLLTSKGGYVNRSVNWQLESLSPYFICQPMLRESRLSIRAKFKSVIVQLNQLKTRQIAYTRIEPAKAESFLTTRGPVAKAKMAILLH